MKATIVDLRYKTAQILKALERNEEVTVLYHGKVRGVIIPVRKTAGSKVTEHPFFGMYRENEEPVEAVIDRLRQPRHAF